ncbi:hypothetical protein DACRYDRAFT_102203 [Dacryopinax primogenitus]|uniref:Uncharacterized protein n=1 Tax=Dacryopinax primogenitus (strain DJM 731) TaxID=1858805 RepID=M5FWV4_DACPD|nr:uncharacterized protein DACRYDRAFT_102203 [Dacryopinax primogenitus]EJT97931.1 hypothetical protein DACRYDRAFT_102203 [Dacryopinax primogenitus]
MHASILLLSIIVSTSLASIIPRHHGQAHHPQPSAWSGVFHDGGDTGNSGSGTIVPSLPPMNPISIRSDPESELPATNAERLRMGLPLKAPTPVLRARQAQGSPTFTSELDSAIEMDATVKKLDRVVIGELGKVQKRGELPLRPVLASQKMEGYIAVSLWPDDRTLGYLSCTSVQCEVIPSIAGSRATVFTFTSAGVDEHVELSFAGGVIGGQMADPEDTTNIALRPLSSSTNTPETQSQLFSYSSDSHLLTPFWSNPSHTSSVQLALSGSSDSGLRLTSDVEGLKDARYCKDCKVDGPLACLSRGWDIGAYIDLSHRSHHLEHVLNAHTSTFTVVTLTPTTMFSNITNKLQETLSNLTDPHHGAPFNSDSASPPLGGSRTLALDQLSQSLRSLQVQYGSYVPPFLRTLQLLITGEKTLGLAYESAAQAGRNHARDLYFWGQEQETDVKDVTDRLAWLEYNSCTLSAQVGTVLSGDARAPLKQLREAEQLLAPRRAARQAAEFQLQRTQTQREKDKIIAGLRQAAAQDAELEARVARASREGVREEERAKWRARREYAERLVLLCRGAEELLDLIPPVPTGAPTAAGIALAGTTAEKQAPYDPAKSADIKSAVQHALDTYVLAQPEPLAVPRGANLSRAASDRRGFGETHGGEIAATSAPGGDHPPVSALTAPSSGTTAPPPSAILPQPGRFLAPTAAPGSVGSAPGLPSQPAPTSPLSHHSILAGSPQPLNPSTLNQAPAPLPPPITSPATSPTPLRTLPPLASATLGSAGAPEETTTTTGAMPTIAETGVPISGGGPKQGSLRKDDHQSTVSGRYMTAEEEKRALERAERERILHGQASPGASGSGAYPSGGPQVPPKETDGEKQAKEEKERLEREERERFLRGEGGKKYGDDDDLPPYAA